MTDDVVEVTLRFHPPVTAEDLREQFQAVAARMEGVEQAQEAEGG